MPLKYLYFPFADFRTDAVMKEIKSRYIKKHDGNLRVADIDSVLGTIQDEEMLIIAAHGSKAKHARKSLWLERMNGTSASITANDLAEHLANKGLQKTHKSGFYNPAISTKTLTEDFWFDHLGALKREHIGLK